MSALVHAAAIHLLFLLSSPVHAQWLDHPVISAASTATTAADFSIATAPNIFSAVSMDGAVYDAFPVKTTSTIASLATAAAEAAQATAAAIAPGSSMDNDDDDKGECKLLGSFAIFVQLALGGLALTSLVYKRWRERPQRPVKIWFFDVSKQVVGSILVHVANVFMSMLTSGRFSIKVDPTAVSTVVVSALVRRFTGPGGEGGDDGEYVPNPCSFYLLNLAIDTTVGIPILILLLRLFTALVAHTPLGKPAESIQSGNYGNPPNAWWWLKQSLIYFLGLFGMKICVLIVFVMFPWISRVGDWALGWTEGNEKLQIVFVMMLFPLIMNALQYYIIDSFIKKQATKEDTEGHGRDGSEGEGGAYQRVLSDDELQVPGQGQRNLAVDDGKGGLRSPVKKPLASPVHEEYNPEVDGERTAIGSSSSTAGDEGRVLTELYLKE